MTLSATVNQSSAEEWNFAFWLHNGCSSTVRYNVNCEEEWAKGSVLTEGIPGEGSFLAGDWADCRQVYLGEGSVKSGETLTMNLSWNGTAFFYHGTRAEAWQAVGEMQGTTLRFQVFFPDADFMGYLYDMSVVVPLHVEKPSAQ